MNKTRESESIIEELEDMFCKREYILNLLSEIKDSIVTRDAEILNHKKAAENNSDWFDVLKIDYDVAQAEIKDLKGCNAVLGDHAEWQQAEIKELKIEVQSYKDLAVQVWEMVVENIENNADYRLYTQQAEIKKLTEENERLELIAQVADKSVVEIKKLREVLTLIKQWSTYSPKPPIETERMKIIYTLATIALKDSE